MADGQSLNGLITVPWIATGSTYVFTLETPQGFPLSTVSVSAIPPQQQGTLDYYNVTRTLQTNFVVGDQFTVNVQNAAHNAQIVIQWTAQNGQTVSYSPGSTNGSGNFAITSSPITGGLGEWEGQWYIGGTPINSTVYTEIIAMPNEPF